MKNPFQLDINTIHCFLKECDNLFKPKLSSIVNLQEYAEKLSKKSVQFCHYIDDNLIGMLAIYVYDHTEKTAFITSISVLKKFQRKGIAKQLLIDAIKYAKDLGFRKVKLEVYNSNIKAISIYEKFGFKKVMYKKDSIILALDIE